MKITEIWFDADFIYGRDEKGKVHKQSLLWYPGLRTASEKERSQYTFGLGGIHWRGLDEDISFESFEYDGMKICNFEMESSALAGLASLLGHRAMTCCMVIANRYAQKMNTEYKNSIDTLIEKVLDRI